MRHSLIILTILVVASCGILKPKPVIEYRDSIRVEYRDRVVHDTATFEIVREVEKVVTRDTVSHLENTYAKSDAVVSDGFLSHSLESIPQIIRIPVEVRVTDTLIVEKHSEATVVEVEKKLFWWQKVRLDAFWPLLAFFALGVMSIILKLKIK